MELSINVKQSISILQTNQITHWLDASNIYGSSEEEIKLLRTFKIGQMKHETITHARSTTPKGLPTCPEAKLSRSRASDHICRHNGCKMADKKCFLAGMFLMHVTLLTISILKNAFYFLK